MTKKITTRKAKKPLHKPLKASSPHAKSKKNPPQKKAKLKTIPWVPGEHIHNTRDGLLYINGALDDLYGEFPDDYAFVADCFGVVAKRLGMADVAKKTGLSREALYRALSYQGNPEFVTILKVARALGMRFKLVKA